MGAKIALLERKATFDTVIVDMAAGAHLAPAFLELSPSGQPPVLIDHEGPSGLHPLAMFEQLAVLSHLDANATRLQLDGPNFVPQTPCNIPLTFQWVAWTRAHLSPAIEGLLLHGKILAPGSRSAASFGQAKQQLKDVVALLEVQVPAPGSFMNRDRLHPGGDTGTFSAADLALVSNLTYARLLPQTEKILEASPNVLAYVGSIEARAPFQTALRGVTLPGTPGEVIPPIELP